MCICWAAGCWAGWSLAPTEAGGPGFPGAAATRQAHRVDGGAPSHRANSAGIGIRARFLAIGCRDATPCAELWAQHVSRCIRIARAALSAACLARFLPGHCRCGLPGLLFAGAGPCFARAASVVTRWDSDPCRMRASTNAGQAAKPAGLAAGGRRRRAHCQDDPYCRAGSLPCAGAGGGPGRSFRRSPLSATLRGACAQALEMQTGARRRPFHAVSGAAQSLARST